MPLAKIWFRGQGDAEWPLVASFDRNLADLDSKTKAKVYDAMTKQFSSRTPRSYGVGELTNSQTICLMQHYGAPTRVLDWSTSPYVAAYFAFASTAAMRATYHRDEQCAIYAFNSSLINASGDDEYGTVKLISEPVGVNDRAWAQHGKFTMNRSTNSDLADELRAIFEKPAERPDTWVLQKITIPRQEARGALRDLELMGITSETLFPGLEGAAKYAYFRALDEINLL